MKTNSQLINTLLIVIGGGLLIFQISQEKDNVYILIIGLVMLMYGLYKATNYWVAAENAEKEVEEGEEEKQDKED